MWKKYEKNIFHHFAAEKNQDVFQELDWSRLAGLVDKVKFQGYRASVQGKATVFKSFWNGPGYCFLELFGWCFLVVKTPVVSGVSFFLKVNMENKTSEALDDSVVSSLTTVDSTGGVFLRQSGGQWPLPHSFT